MPSGIYRHYANKDAVLESVLEEVARIISEGQIAGRIRTDVPADSAAVMFLGLVQPAIIPWLMSNQTFNVARHAERAWDLFREALESRRRLQVHSRFDVRS